MMRRLVGFFAALFLAGLCGTAPSRWSWSPGTGPATRRRRGGYAGAGEGDYDLSRELDAVGADELLGELPDDAQDLMERTGLHGIDYKELLALSPEAFFREIWGLVKERIRLPLTVFGAVLGTVLLCAMLDGLKTSLWEGTLSTVFAAVAVVCVAASIVSPIIDCITTTAAAIRDYSNVVLAFIPIFSSIVTVGGQAVTATTYTAFLFMACQVVSQVVAGNLRAADGGLPRLLRGREPRARRRRVGGRGRDPNRRCRGRWGCCSPSSWGCSRSRRWLRRAATTVASKAAKFLIGSFVPVVGGALSDAFVATQGYLRLLKATVGVFGILIALMTFLPVFLQTVLWYFTVNLAGAVSEMLGVKPVASILKSSSATLGILIAVILCFALLIVISTSLVMMVSTGV